MRFTNLTRENAIGANSYLLQFDHDATVILDAGMSPKQEGFEATPFINMTEGTKPDAIFVTHAHHDHIGALPVMMRHHPDTRVFMSEPTYFLADPLLHNSVEVMSKQRTEKGISEYPLFTHKEIDRLSKTWQACHLETPWSLKGFPKPDRGEAVKFTFHDAGHILGAVGIDFHHRGRRLFYTGDVNFRSQRLMAPATFPRTKLDALIIETTRGSHQSPDSFHRDGEVQKLLSAINATFDRGGAVLIPVFAMGKTQELLTELYLAQRTGAIPECPIFIGGLGRSFTAIYDKLAPRSARQYPTLDLLHDVAPEVLDGRKIADFKPRKGNIYLVSSGMMTERTTSNLIAPHFLAHEHHSVLFVGYADPASPAGKLLATPHGQSVQLEENGIEYPVKCQVNRFDFTAHAQREDLLDFILATDPETCLLVHGDRPALDWFKEQLEAARPKMRVLVPPPGEAIEF